MASAWRKIGGVGGPVGGGSGVGAASYREAQTVTANVTVTTAYSTAAAGDLLTVVLTLDGTGGWQITAWNAIFTGVTVNDFDSRATYKNKYLFQWDGAAWDLVSYRAHP